MKACAIALFSACLLVLVLPAVILASSNTTNEENTSSSSQTVGSIAATAIQNRITARPGTGGGSGGSGGGLSDSQFGTGQSAGDNPAGIGLWALGSANFLDNIKDGAKYDGSLSTATVGVDKLFGSLLVGVGLGFEKLDLTTKYNVGKMNYDGFSVTPYASYSISNELVADASLSYTWLDYTMKDTQAGVGYSDQMGANRMVGNIGLTRYLSLDKLLLSGRLGTMYMNEHHDSYRLNTTTYSSTSIYNWQGSVGLRGTYDMGKFKPFLGATYMADLLKSGAITNDMWGADVDLGFTYNLSDTFLLGLTGTYGARENLTKTGCMLNIRYDF